MKGLGSLLYRKERRMKHSKCKHTVCMYMHVYACICMSEFYAFNHFQAVKSYGSVYAVIC